jgi:hypothetical protein
MMVVVHNDFNKQAWYEANGDEKKIRLYFSTPMT